MSKRRDFIRQLLTVSAGAAVYSLDPLRPRLRIAAAASGKTLVVVFQRGGCDGLNTVVPYGDPFYAGLRPTIGIPAPNPGNSSAALDLNGFFGLHPGLAALMPVWQAGDLAVLPAVQYPDASQSHFDGQQFIESGAPDPSLDGWLNRHLVAFPQSAALRACGFGSELAHSLRGQAVVSSFNNLANFTTGLPGPEEAELIADLTRIFDQQPDDTKSYRSLMQESGRVMVSNVNVANLLNSTTYVPANGAAYPNTGLGTQLKQVAQIIKESLGLEVAALSIGGWDTHDSQGGPTGQQAGRHQDFAGSLAAFWQDLGALMADVVVLTMTEFGRTAKENASRGTDHGHASAWFAIGGNVRGGIYGAWPGLSTQQLEGGRYLNHSVDFRDVMAEALIRHMGDSDVSAILPGHAYAPVGFLP